LRLPAAKRLPGIDHVWNVQKDDVPALVQGLTRGRGADLVVEASGSEGGIALALNLVRKLGRVAAIGLTGKEKIQIPYETGMKKAVRFIFNMSTSYTSWDRAIFFLNSGKIKVGPLVTHKGGLEKWEEFFKVLDEKKG